MHDAHIPIGFLFYLVAATCAFLATLSIALRIIGKRDVISNYVRVSRAVTAGGFAIGMVTHLENWLRLGLIPAPDQPLAFNVFWSSLIAIDPLIAVLVIFQYRIGIVLAIIVMITDLAINLLAFIRAETSAAQAWPLYSQLTFFIFICIVTRRCWTESVAGWEPHPAHHNAT